MSEIMKLDDTRQLDFDRETVELFRSKETLARKERETKGDEAPALIAEEKVRQRRHQDELRRLLKAACLSGSVYFRGNDRSPGDRAADVGKSASEILGQVLPEVFDRFKEAAARTNDVKKTKPRRRRNAMYSSTRAVIVRRRFTADSAARATRPAAAVRHRYSRRWRSSRCCDGASDLRPA